MMTRRILLGTLAASLCTPVRASADFTFASIDGGQISLAGLRGQPVLVVNTASLCAYTPQYDQLQALHEAYAGRAVILAVPSDDFGGQELSDEAEVKEFCELNFALTLPMTEITKVRGARQHPFYRWAADQGVIPRWNFHKILLDTNGAIAAEFPTTVSPTDPKIRGAIDRLL